MPCNNVDIRRQRVDFRRGSLDLHISWQDAERVPMQTEVESVFLFLVVFVEMVSVVMVASEWTALRLHLQ